MIKSRLGLAVVAGAAVFALGVSLGLIGPRLSIFNSGAQRYHTATVIQQIQTLSELVTVKYVMEKIQVLENPTWYGQDRVLLVAHGVVKAGVDLRQLQADDLRLGGKTVSLALPAARITDAYLDDTQSSVIERSTGLLRAFDRDKDLEQNARQQAVDDIRRAARNSGILKDAEERARAQVENLFSQLGFAAVEIRFR